MFLPLPEFASKCQQFLARSFDDPRLLLPMATSFHKENIGNFWILCNLLVQINSLLQCVDVGWSWHWRVFWTHRSYWRHNQCIHINVAFCTLESEHRCIYLAVAMELARLIAITFYVLCIFFLYVFEEGTSIFNKMKMWVIHSISIFWQHHYPLPVNHI